MRPCVFLDRDGTIIAERHYLADPSGVVLLDGAAEGLRILQRAGFGLVLITNQSGIGRGYFDHDQLAAVHQRLNELLKAEDVVLQAIYYCPHAPQDECDCRKPKSGLLEQAAAELGCALGDSFVIGDKQCDIDLGKSVSASTILVRTGYGAQEERRLDVRPNHVVDDLMQASHVILSAVEMENRIWDQSSW
jgi:D,D-heptose 1,7-bisphosphate phosphatase